MRLAREYERAEGRDLRGFLAYAVGQDLAEAREGEAALESEGLDAVRLMTIHRAKGLEFPVVCVADLGRHGRDAARDRLLIGDDGRAGLRLATLEGGEPVPALGYDRIAERAGRRRGRRGAAAALRRRHARGGAADPVRRRRHREVAGAARRGGPPLDWLAPALLGEPAAGRRASSRRCVVRCGAGARRGAARHRRRTCRRRRAAPAPRGAAPAPGHRAARRAEGDPGRRAARSPAQRRLSYSSLQDYARCGYRFYLDARARPAARRAAAGRRRASPAGRRPSRSRGGMRGPLVHLLLERLDFARPAPPGAEEVVALGAAHGHRARAGAGRGHPRPGRGVRRARRCARGSPPRAASAARPASPSRSSRDGGGPLVTGFVDVLARERDGTRAGRRLQDRPAGRGRGAGGAVARAYATQRMVYALAALRDGAPRVEVAYALLERPAEPVDGGVHRGGRARAGPTLLATRRRACSPSAGPSPRARTASCAATAPAAPALCSLARGDDAAPAAGAYEDSAGTFAGSGGPS